MTAEYQTSLSTVTGSSPLLPHVLPCFVQVSDGDERVDRGDRQLRDLPAPLLGGQPVALLRHRPRLWTAASDQSDGVELQVSRRRQLRLPSKT